MHEAHKWPRHNNRNSRVLARRSIQVAQALSWPAMAVFLACGSDPVPAPSDEGPASGGLLSTGGARNPSGGSASGGTVSPGTGGVVGVGGVQESSGGASSGGETSTGGRFTGGGGAPGAGGSSNSGGHSPVGGTGAGGDSGGSSPGSGGWAGEIPRFVGNITTGNSIDTGGLTYSNHWDQITPENAGKWGSVQRTATSAPSWATLDAIYDYSLKSGVVFKQHAFIWGSQQPSGTIGEAEVRAWMKGFCDRYPGTRLIDVVNEPPPHTTPGYANSIGGGTNGNWQWVTNAFKWAHEACPNAILILNDFNNIEWSNDNQHFIDIVKTVMQNGGPIDAVGAQAHDLDNGSVSFQTVEKLLNKLHTDTGLPVYITELDLSYTDDQQQLNGYKQYFPLFWGKDFVPGITIWGWIYGKTWSQAPNSGLVRDGKARPAMSWLMGELDRPAP